MDTHDLDTILAAIAEHQADLAETEGDAFADPLPPVRLD